MNQGSEDNGAEIRWDEILTNAVHDLRTPLSAMLTALEMLNEVSDGSERSAKLIALMRRQISEISSQLERLLRDPSSFLQPPSSK